MNPNVLQLRIMNEMDAAGVVFNGSTNDRKKAIRYSRVGKDFTVTRKQRIDAYERALENIVENAEVLAGLASLGLRA